MMLLCYALSTIDTSNVVWYYKPSTSRSSVVRGGEIVGVSSQSAMDSIARRFVRLHPYVKFYSVVDDVA